jgi:hypothetical protein
MAEAMPETTHARARNSDAQPDVQPELGEAVLDAALGEAKSRFGSRLVSAYALGSLAHGGFSAHVSDVDLGLVLSDPLLEEDAAAIEALNAAVKATGLTLADRLSTFWGSQLTLSGKKEGGRFPPVDCLDLKQNGRLLAGTDIRSQVAEPGTDAMVVSAARMALKMMSTAEVIAGLREPAALIRSGVRPLTKRVLFPVRFVFTARTGRVGTNDAAVEYFTAAESGPAAELARRGYQWRSLPYDENDAGVYEVVRAGLLPLYRLFVEDYAPRLDACGETALAQGMREWRSRLN